MRFYVESVHTVVGTKHSRTFKDPNRIFQGPKLST